MVKLGVRDLTIRYGGVTALEGVNFDIHQNEIFGIIGPANAGKTSFLKAVNRMDLFDSAMDVDGDITFNGVNVRRVRNVYGLRRRHSCGRRSIQTYSVRQLRSCRHRRHGIGHLSNGSGRLCGNESTVHPQRRS